MLRYCLDSRAAGLRPGATANSSGSTAVNVIDDFSSVIHPRDRAEQRASSPKNEKHTPTQKPIEATFEYDELSNRVRAVDEGGRETDYHFDELKRLVETVKASPDGVAGRPVVKKGYDSLGRLVSYENENGSVWRFGFDGLGRLVSEEDPLGQGKSYVHDLAGNVVGKTDAKGQVTSFGYDELNRLVRVDFADGKWAALSYDSADNRVGLTGSSGSETMSVSQAFDELNRLQSVTNGNLGRELRYGYTAAGRRSSMSLVNLADSSSKTSSYSWDSRGRVAGIVPWAGSAVSYGYNPDGTRATVALPNGLSLSHSYDSLGRLAEMRYENGAGESVGFFRYTLDVMGNRVQVEDSEGVSTYSYDFLDRLVEAQYPDGSWERFGMDLAGNRVRHEDGDGVTSYLLDAGDRLLATSGAKAAVYTWDANGNMLTKTDSAGTTSYTWDGRDKLVSVSLPGGAGSVSYGYHPLSDLRSYVQSADGVEKRFLYDGSNVVEEIAGGSLASLAGYIEGVGVDQHLARVVGGDVYAYVGDALGTVRGVFDASGQAVNTYAYKAYGEVRDSSGSDAGQNPYRFTGRRWDGDVGEYYYRARYYQPGLGRFSAVDPLVPREMAYVYANQNPNRYVDVLGMNPWENAEFHWSYGTGKFATASAVFDVAINTAATCCTFDNIFDDLGDCPDQAKCKKYGEAIDAQARLTEKAWKTLPMTGVLRFIFLAPAYFFMHGYHLIGDDFLSWPPPAMGQTSTSHVTINMSVTGDPWSEGEKATLGKLGFCNVLMHELVHAANNRNKLRMYLRLLGIFAGLQMGPATFFEERAAYRYNLQFLLNMKRKLREKCVK